MRRYLAIFLAAGCTFMCPAALLSVRAVSLNDIYDTVSDNDLDHDHDDSTRVLVDYDDLIMLFNDYPSYQGTIPELYIDYMRYVLSWSSYGDRYVAFVSSYTVNSNTRVYYVIALGDITYSNGRFFGTDIDVYEFFPNRDTFNSYSNYRHSLQSSFSYIPSSTFCFTDITSDYPDIRGQTDKFFYVLLTFLALFVCFYTFTKFGWHNLRRRKVLK